MEYANPDQFIKDAQKLLAEIQESLISFADPNGEAEDGGRIEIVVEDPELKAYLSLVTLMADDLRKQIQAVIKNPLARIPNTIAVQHFEHIRSTVAEFKELAKSSRCNDGGAQDIKKYANRDQFITDANALLSEISASLLAFCDPNGEAKDGKKIELRVDDESMHEPLANITSMAIAIRSILKQLADDPEAIIPNVDVDSFFIEIRQSIDQFNNAAASRRCYDGAVQHIH